LHKNAKAKIRFSAPVPTNCFLQTPAKGQNRIGQIIFVKHSHAKKMHHVTDFATSIQLLGNCTVGILDVIKATGFYNLLTQAASVISLGVIKAFSARGFFN